MCNCGDCAMPVLKLSGSAPLLDPASWPVSWSPTSIDLSELRWATPFDIVVLGLIWTRLAEDGREPELVLPEDAGVRAYLVDAGLATAIPGAWNVRGDR